MLLELHFEPFFFPLLFAISGFDCTTLPPRPVNLASYRSGLLQRFPVVS